MFCIYLLLKIFHTEVMIWKNLPMYDIWILGNFGKALLQNTSKCSELGDATRKKLQNKQKVISCNGSGLEEHKIDEKEAEVEN